MRQTGIVYLVGAGPGDPELITVKAARILAHVDVVIYDRLVSEEILDLVPAGAARIFVGKETGRHHMDQDSINDMLVRLGRAGNRVARLKGGDPYVFGRGSEEALYLIRHGVPFEVVPGVTAAAGCGAAVGVPLTHRGLASGVRFVTGHRDNDGVLALDWRGLADPDTTLAIYMGLAQAGLLSAELIAAGLPGDTPVVAVEQGTTPRQREVFTTLAELPRTAAETDLKPPTLLIIGRVVALAAQLKPAVQVDIDDVANA